VGTYSSTSYDTKKFAWMECARPASRYVEIPGSTLPASDHLDCGPFVAGIDLIVVLRLQSFDKSSSTIK